jgi:hypothetical protein
MESLKPQYNAHVELQKTTVELEERVNRLEKHSVTHEEYY